MNHPLYIAYPGGLQQLSVDIPNLRYDMLYAFVTMMQRKLYLDATNDSARGNVKLSVALYKASEHFGEAAKELLTAWRLSKPKMQVVAELKAFIEDATIDDTTVRTTLECLTPELFTPAEQSEIFAHLEQVRPEVHRKWRSDVAGSYM